MVEGDIPADGTGELPVNTAALETGGTEGVVAGEETGLSVGLVTEETQQRVPLSLSSITIQAISEGEHPSRHFELDSVVLN